MKKILIPHLGYTIFIEDISKAPKDIKEDMSDAYAFVSRDNFNTSTMYFHKDILVKKVPYHLIPTVFHETIHVLQNIALDRHIEFKLEKEHFGYLANYISNHILGVEYDV